MNVMLLAAGEGTRLRPFTYILPKPAIPFLNVPLAAHSLHFLNSIEISKLVVNTYHLPSHIHRLFQTLDHGAKSLHFSDEAGLILGSGGGLNKAKEHFVGGGDFILMNADEVILPREADVLTRALQQHRDNNALATLLVIDHPGVGKEFGGVWADFSGKVYGFGKSAFEKSQKGWHFVGVQILSDRVFDYVPQRGASNILYDALTLAIERGEKIETFPFAGTWFETGNFHDYFFASKTCLNFLCDYGESYQKNILNNVLKKHLPQGFKIEKNSDRQCLIAKDVEIDVSAQVEGLLIAGPGVQVEKSCRLRNVIIGSGVKVPEQTQANDTLLI
jgi:mannose-1-phosphate guanylyltransferase